MMYARDTMKIDYTYTEVELNSQSQHSIDTISPQAYHKSDDNGGNTLVGVRPRLRAHWYAPTVMVVCYVLGVLFIVTEHLVFHFLDGSPVSPTVLTQVNANRLGNTLAFLVKTCFAVTSAIAYVQQQYLTMHQRTFLLPEMDILYGIINDIKKFINIRFWRSNLLLLVPALVTWLAPIATVVGGSIMSVTPGVEYQAVQADVPQLHLDDQVSISSDGSTEFPYRLRSLALQAALSGGTLPMPSPGPNATYILTYTGPTVSCRDIGSSSVAAAFQAFNGNLTNGGYSYYSYVPSDAASSSFDAANFNGNGSTKAFDTLDQSTSGPATLNIFFQSLQDAARPSFHYVSCELWNITQTVLFNLTFANQTTSFVDNPKYVNPVGFANLTGAELNSQLHNDTVSYLITMEMLGYVLAGSTQPNSDNSASFADQTSAQLTPILFTDSNSAIQGITDTYRTMIMSYLSDSLFTKNISTEVTLQAPTTYFYYHEADLVAAFGSLAFGNLVCVIIGLQAFYRNRASYTSCFSTTMRALRGATWDHSLLDRDDATDPMPYNVSTMQIHLGEQFDRAARIS